VSDGFSRRAQEVGENEKAGWEGYEVAMAILRYLVWDNF
jgi:hypothetical protein